MCCFSATVRHVSQTQIFARGVPNGDQYLVYSMTINAPKELAMILPLPTPLQVREDAVKFINLKEQATFFSWLASGFPVPQSLTKGGGFGRYGGYSRGEPLPVQQVGNFEASFVPTVGDFARLDPRFRLPENVWARLPQYQKGGFAVFKLKAGEQQLHPMAFRFPRVDARRLFFPTVHIHDGKVHATATFDHTLYCQRNTKDTFPLGQWQESPRLAGQFMDVGQTSGIVDGTGHLYRRILRGRLPNTDTWLS